MHAPLAVRPPTAGTARTAVRLGAIGLVLVGTLSASHRGLDVTLVVDGVARQVQVAGGTVAGLLADQELGLGPHDLVAPAGDHRLQSREQVVVRYGRPLQLTVDGASRDYWTTELTVAGALRSLGIRSEGAELSASRDQALGRRGLSLVMTTPKQVTLTADGRMRRFTTTAATVAEALREQGVTPRPADRLSVLGSAPVVDGLLVALTRVDRRRAAAELPVPFPVTRRPDPGMTTGDTEVVTEGRAGSRHVVYEVVLADGREVGRRVVTSTTGRAPVTQVVKVGTAPKPVTETDGDSGVDSLNWTALAQCESGGNPRAVNPAGYYGLFQFSRSTWRSVGGSGLPSEASAGEQLSRAKALYRRGGAGQWGCGRKLFS